MMEENPFERINLYTRATVNGVSVDTEAMVSDVVTVFKAGGLPKAALHAAVEEMWDELEVSVYVPKKDKN